nr:hypothetical protein Iba_chr10fCG4200 [Ipomoea batatas]
MQARKTTAPFSTIDDILRKLCRIVSSVYIQTFTSPARAADVVRDRSSTLSSYTLRHQRVLLSRSFGEHAFGFLLNHHCCRYYRLPEVLQPVSSVVAKWDFVLHTKMQSETHDPSVFYHNNHQEEDPLGPSYHRYQAKALPGTQCFSVIHQLLAVLL